MFNYETILSVFDEQGTLLKWLKKLEKTIDTATIKEVRLEKQSSQSDFFKIVFVLNDDSEIESNYVQMPSGAKGDKGDKGDKGERGNTIDFGTENPNISMQEPTTQVGDLYIQSNGNVYKCTQIIRSGLIANTWTIVGANQVVTVVAYGEQVVNGYTVPRLSYDNIIAINNVLKGNGQCVLQDMDNAKQFSITSCIESLDTGDIAVSILYGDIMILTYTADESFDVTTTYKEI